MGMSENSGPLNLTVPIKVIEFLDYLVERRLSNYGTSKNGIATFIVMREIDKMMKKDAFADYWRQGIGPKPS